jgi:hypothetical protein
MPGSPGKSFSLLMPAVQQRLPGALQGQLRTCAQHGASTAGCQNGAVWLLASLQGLASLQHHVVRRTLCRPPT